MATTSWYNDHFTESQYDRLIGSGSYHQDKLYQIKSDEPDKPFSNYNYMKATNGWNRYGFDKRYQDLLSFAADIDTLRVQFQFTRYRRDVEHIWRAEVIIDEKLLMRLLPRGGWESNGTDTILNPSGVAVLYGGLETYEHMQTVSEHALINIDELDPAQKRRMVWKFYPNVNPIRNAASAFVYAPYTTDITFEINVLTSFFSADDHYSMPDYQLTDSGRRMLFTEDVYNSLVEDDVQTVCAASVTFFRLLRDRNEYARDMYTVEWLRNGLQWVRDRILYKHERKKDQTYIQSMDYDHYKKIYSRRDLDDLQSIITTSGITERVPYDAWESAVRRLLEDMGEYSVGTLLPSTAHLSMECLKCMIHTNTLVTYLHQKQYPTECKMCGPEDFRARQRITRKQLEEIPGNYDDTITFPDEYTGLLDIYMIAEDLQRVSISIDGERYMRYLESLPVPFFDH